MTILPGDAFVAAGCTNVSTYIASGNVLFAAPATGQDVLFNKIRAKTARLVGAEPGIAFRSVRDIARVVKAAPFSALASDPAIKLYVAFLTEKPARKPKFPLLLPREAIEAVAMTNLEVFLVSRRKPKRLLRIPHLFVEKELGVPATARNWSTVTKIAPALVRTGQGPPEGWPLHRPRINTVTAVGIVMELQLRARPFGNSIPSVLIL